MEVKEETPEEADQMAESGGEIVEPPPPPPPAPPGEFQEDTWLLTLLPLETTNLLAVYR